MSAPNSCRETFGSHKDTIQRLIDQWNECPQYESQRRGLKILSQLLSRSESFYLAEGSFDYPDHPFKAIPLPKEDIKMTAADAIYDLLAVGKDSTIDCVNVDSGMGIPHDDTPTGPEMVAAVMGYLATSDQKEKQKRFSDLALPQSLHEAKQNEAGTLGLARWDAMPHISRGLNHVHVTPWSKFSSVFSCGPSATTSHFDTVLCGLAMVHFYGKKIWIFTPSDAANRRFINPHETNPFNCMDMILNAPSLLVWVCKDPCVFFMPPRYFHAVLTPSLACHKKIRVFSLDWKSEVEDILGWIVSNATKHVETDTAWKHLWEDLRAVDNWAEDSWEDHKDLMVKLIAASEGLVSARVERKEAVRKMAEKVPQRRRRRLKCK